MSNENAHNPYEPPKAEVLGEGPVEKLPQTALASRWRRLWGGTIDSLLLMSVNLPIIIFLMPETWERAKSGTMTLGESLVGIAIGAVVFLAFNGYLLARRGQTIGKLALGMRIVSRESGQLLPLRRLLGLRYGPLWLLGLFPVASQFGGVINALFIFRRDRRCIHDHIAGTIVTMVTPQDGKEAQFGSPPST